MSKHESALQSLAVYIEVAAGVRYWEDADINGVEDGQGIFIPLRDGDLWKPTILLSDGVIMEWPVGTYADIHYKVCDEGQYWLLDENRKRIAKWAGFYVPNRFLCHGDNGFGDYIILRIATDGQIIGWSSPEIIFEQWNWIATT